MSNISSYYQNRNYYYQKTAYSSGAAASGASGMVTKKLGTVDKLSISEMTDLFTSGNLTVSEVQKWCQSKKISCGVRQSGNFYVITFYYNNKDYTIKLKICIYLKNNLPKKCLKCKNKKSNSWNK